MVMNAISGFLNTTGESTSGGILNEMHYLPFITSKPIPAVTGKQKISRDRILLMPTLVIQRKRGFEMFSVGCIRSSEAH
jgi:hypothetical protein